MNPVKKEQKKYINNARLLLICIAGLQLYNTLRYLPYFDYWSVIMIAFFAGMALWAKYNPFAALLIALITWLSVHVYYLVTDSDSGTFYFQVMMAIVIDGLITAVLGLGIREAWNLRDHKKTD